MTLDARRQSVLVLGLGDTGLSMARWLARQGGARARRRHARRAAGAARCKRAARGAAGHRRRSAARSRRRRPDRASARAWRSSEPIVRRRSRTGSPVVGDVELFARAQRDAGAKVLAITGTNGKTTVTALAGAIAARRRASTAWSPATSAAGARRARAADRDGCPTSACSSCRASSSRRPRRSRRLRRPCSTSPRTISTATRASPTMRAAKARIFAGRAACRC